MAGPEEYPGAITRLATYDGCMVESVMIAARRQCIALATRLALEQNGPAEVEALSAKIGEINEIPCGYRGNSCPRILPVQTLLVNGIEGADPS